MSISCSVSRNQNTQSCFDWFVTRARKKIPGTFASDFWDTLVLQVSIQEQAVLYSLVALASAHKSRMLSLTGIPENENYTLQHYNAAICHLQHHLASGSKESIRIVAISCLIFICLEFMRSNIETGTIHLQNGLNLLPLLQPQSCENGALVLKAHNESLEDVVTEAFLRLFVYSAQLHRFSRDVFHSRQHLDELFNRIHRLEADARQLQALSRPVTTAMLQKQQRIQTDLDCWLSLFNNSFAGIANRDLEESLPLTLLRIHHTMAYIMAGTSLAPRNELAYDQFKSSFDSIISLSDHILEAAASIMAADIIHGVCTEQFSFSADMGIILPLYYTILKCRCPITRRRALKLLLPVSHQEGIWNGPLSAAIARGVIQIEEDGYYRCYPIEDLALQKSVITPIPILLESHRISDVFIEPLESSTGGIIWSYHRTQENGQLSV
ncbi:transcriptional regulatory moc3 [Fusarium tjaetaba]|uniref:Transcriptional regulatory moc3 n=1 Tax=Fusarium tjaetaba TaxID=1567544 RepID=A0A8H5S1M1_9HYPO|nr:transcriptional regulatory moc3 [Fusarium tjaetaba]KAF5642472.1 transcriptional regulatory moc3 [Fusarium tjaetaba]